MNTPDTFPPLFWGYTVIWLLIVAYFFILRLKVTKIEKRLEDNNGN